MAHNHTVTQVFRSHRYITSTWALLDRAREDFGSSDGKTRLARRLGISRNQAGRMIAGTPSIGMHRLAFHYGFMPEIGESDAWRALPMTEQPFDDGPEMRWDAAVVEYVHDVLTVKGDLRPSARELAWRMDTTERRLRDALRRRKLRLTAPSP